MAFVINDRVKETTTTTGTGTLTLAGAVTGFETFGTGIGNSNTTYYAVTLPGSAEFEVGLGTLNSDSSTIARTTIISSSNSDSAVNFSAGTKTIFCTIPASKSVLLSDVGASTLNLSSADTHAGRYGSSSSPIIIKVTVASKSAHPYQGDGSGNAYYLNGVEAPALTFHGVDNTTSDSGYYYRFDQSDSSNSSHPLRFYLDADKTTAYTTGVTTNGTAGSSGAYTQIDVDEDTPNILYYQCSSHGYMGNYAITLGSNKINHTEALISFPTTTGTLVGTGDTGSVTNDMLAGSIASSKLAGSIADSKLSTISTADKVSGAAVQIDGATDGTSITIADSDKFLIDDGGTTKYVNASQVNTYTSANATDAVNAAHVLVTDNESTNEENLITFVEDATSSTGNVGLEMDGNLTYNPSTGRLTATQLAGTLQTAAQGNITSLGTLTTLTVDDVTINGSTISDAGDFTLDVGANIEINADGGTITFKDGAASLGTITSSGYSGTAAVATVATTVTITDNENTNEDNAVVFTAGGDVDGGNLGLESDGDLTYNPSTGRLTATQLAGTLQTAAQTNITSVGTLSSLTTSGNIELGHASDTTLSRASAGVLAVEGNNVLTSATGAGKGFAVAMAIAL